jgi:hypothetical protein
MKTLNGGVNKETCSPLPRSPTRVMKNRAMESSFLSPTPKVTTHSTINEVRDSLKMPSIGLSPQDVDDVISDVNYDEISAVASPYRSPKRASVNASLNSTRYHQKELPMEQARGKKWISSDASVASTKSTKSTRSIRSFFTRKSTPNARGDDVSVAVSTKPTKSRWWNRSVSQKSPIDAREATSVQSVGRIQPIQSFRVKKAEKRTVRGADKNNDQLVADFFDVKSLASEPDFVGSSKLRRATSELKKDRMLETQSVSSGRSLRSNVFSKFFLRMRAINDEVQDIDPPNLAGNAVIAYDEVSFDDDITLGSSFDNLSRMGSLPDDYDESSQGSVYSLDSTGTNNDYGDSLKEAPLKETPFLQRIMQRRILKNEATILRDVVGRGPSSSGPASEYDSPRLESPVQRNKVLGPGLMKISSTKSVGDLPSYNESEQISPSRAVNRGLCRWNSDHDLASVPSAPKRPSRETEPEGGNVVSSPSRSPKKTLDKNIKTSQSMRNLSCSSECKMSDGEDDDSILSLLSGLLATWSAEREAVNTVASVSQGLASCGSAWKPKSILKSISESFEEQKIETRGPFSVSFDTIEIREYERVVGDNPSCSKGPPISIGWECLLCRLYRINDYEKHVRGPRRTKKEFHLAADKRTHLLVDVWERSEDDIRKARREATYIQYCRAKTAFSGSRAAAKEAAFLRKANDRSKNSLLTEALNMMDDQMPSEISPKPRSSNIEPIRPPSRGKVPSSPSPKPPSARHNPFLEV